MNIKKITTALLVITAAQFLAALSLLIDLSFGAAKDISPMVWICIAMILLSGLLTAIGLFVASEYKNRNYEESMKHLEELNRKLREQKHDLMNHFQVVYGLMELGEHEEAHRYIQPVFRGIQKLNYALKTEQPAVNALLQAKLETAEEQQIDMYLTVGSTLKEIYIRPWDLCRILANLIDNGMTALMQNNDERQLHVVINENSDNYVFEISNNGPVIPEEVMPHLFRAGFTTKKEEGHGQGLAIVQRLVREAGGEITVSSNEDETIFTVMLPKHCGK